MADETMSISKLLAIIFSVLAGLSIIVYVFLGSHMNQEHARADDEQSTYQSTKNNIKQMDKETSDNQLVIHRSESHPEKIAKDAVQTADDFLNHVRKSNVGTEDERIKNYKKGIDRYASEDLLDGESILDMRVPEKYKLYPGTSKGNQVYVLMETQSAKNDTYNHYAELEVDTINHKVTSYVEYEKAGDK